MKCKFVDKGMIKKYDVHRCTLDSAHRYVVCYDTPNIRNHYTECSYYKKKMIQDKIKEILK